MSESDSPNANFDGTQDKFKGTSSPSKNKILNSEDSDDHKIFSDRKEEVKKGS
jgi:hypothetical protein